MNIKSQLLALAALAAACACSKEIDYHRDDIKPQLQMFAQMVAGDSVHVVHLAISKDVTVAKVQSGTVKCFINGKLAAEGSQVDGDLYIRDDNVRTWMDSHIPSTMGQTSFAFSADFKPGDLVRIEAEADGGTYKASSEVTVPEAPTIEISDTTLTKDTDGIDVYKVRVKGKDIAGEKSFYRLTAGVSREVRTYSYEYQNGTYTFNGTHTFPEESLRIDKDNDPILRDGAPADDVDLTGASLNTFNVFSDNMFRDGTFGISFNVFERDIIDISTRSEHREEYGVFLTSTLHVHVSGVSEVEYNYLKALGIYDYMEGDISFTEPVSFPDNVDGGVGVVSITTPGSASIVFKRRIITGGSVYYD